MPTRLHIALAQRAAANVRRQVVPATLDTAGGRRAGNGNSAAQSRLQLRQGKTKLRRYQRNRSKPFD